MTLDPDQRKSEGSGQNRKIKCGRPFYCPWRRLVPRVVRAFASELLDLRCLVNEMNSKLTGYWMRCARPSPSSNRRVVATPRAYARTCHMSMCRKRLYLSVSVSNVELDGSRRKQTRHDQSSQ